MKKLFWITIAVLGVMVSGLLFAYGPSPFAVATGVWNDSIPRVDSCDTSQDRRIQAALDTATAARDTASVALDTAQAARDTATMALDTAKFATTPTEAAVIAGDSARFAAGDSLAQARIEIHDTADDLRAEMPDSARGVVHDTADDLRAEMPDSSRGVVHDTSDILRAEMPDSAMAAVGAGIIFTGKAGGKFYDSDTAEVDSALITLGTLGKITDDTTHWNLSTKKVFCYMYSSDSLVIDTGYVDTALFNRTTGDFMNCTPDTTSGWRVVTVADTGLYQVSARIEVDYFSPHETGAMEIYVYKDGALYAVGAGVVSSSLYINSAATVSTTVHVTASATFGIRVKAICQSATTLKAAPGATRCWMQVVKIN